MRPAYTLKATNKFESDANAPGTTQDRALYSDLKGGFVVEEVRRLPELGPCRSYDDSIVLGRPVVLDIKGRRFKVTVKDRDDWGEDYSIPVPGEVTFEETDEPETPFEVWDAPKALDTRIASLKRYIAEMKAWGDTDTAWIQQTLDVAEADKAHENFEPYRPSSNTVAFGQPNFIQNRAYPVHQGKAAFHLLTFETGWGDAGNENYMVALDDEGYPVAVFHEASCC